MKNKLSYIILLVVVIASLIFLMRMGEFPQSKDFRPIATDSKSWPLVQKKDTFGNPIYSIKMPQPATDERASGYVEFSDTSVLKPNILNKLIILAKPNDDNVKNIDEYFTKHPFPDEDDYGTLYYGGKPVFVGKYRAYKVHTSDRDLTNHQTILFMLTKQNIVEINIDYPNGCIEWNKGDQLESGETEQLLALCKGYFGIYMPIIDKILSSLLLENYVDDRGFAADNSYYIDELFH